MKRIFVIGLLSILVVVSSCTKYNYIDTGVSKNNQDKTMYEYFKSDSYNWALLSEMIERADIVNMFDGSDSKYTNIMYLGPVDNSIRKWMYDNKYTKVSDVPADLCKKLVLRYVSIKSYAREEVPVGEPGIAAENPYNGGVILTMMSGNQVWFYSNKTPFMDNPEILITTLFCVVVDTGQKGWIASSGIITKTGTVHSLHDSHQIGKFNL